jgi:sigma-E factor negative regulatory protein RseB
MTRRAVLALALGLALSLVGPQARAGTATTQAAAVATPRGAAGWLERLQNASRGHTYVGTFVVSSNAGAMSSARIWHACDGETSVDKLEALTGAPRAIFRRSGEQLTLLPGQRLARFERREMSGAFPQLLKSADHRIADFYDARVIGTDRVAGHEADVVVLAPRDEHRFGYRLWSEKRTGLMIKLQTLAPTGEVLEQAAFTDLQLDVPLRPARLAQDMVAPEGWRVERVEATRSQQDAQAWMPRVPVPGFRPVDCYKRRTAAGHEQLHCIFSDGLASVSVFAEPPQAHRVASETLLSAGASQTLTRRLDTGWVTVVGEVPPQTLKAFAQGLERRR